MIALTLSVLALAAPVPAKPEGQPIESVVHNGHFEKNNSRLKGDTSVMVFTDAEGMGKVLGTVPPLIGKGANKPNPVTADAFEKGLVACVITRGPAIVNYTGVSTALEGTTLKVKYTATAGAAGSATFASPLVVSVPKEGIKEVVFVEGDKEVGKVEVK